MGARLASREARRRRRQRPPASQNGGARSRARRRAERVGDGGNELGRGDGRRGPWGRAPHRDAGRRRLGGRWSSRWARRSAGRGQGRRRGVRACRRARRGAGAPTAAPGCACAVADAPAGGALALIAAHLRRARLGPEPRSGHVLCRGRLRRCARGSGLHTFWGVRGARLGELGAGGHVLCRGCLGDFAPERLLPLPRCRARGRLLPPARLRPPSSEGTASVGACVVGPLSRDVEGSRADRKSRGRRAGGVGATSTGATGGVTIGASSPGAVGLSRRERLPHVLTEAASVGTAGSRGDDRGRPRGRRRDLGRHGRRLLDGRCFRGDDGDRTRGCGRHGLLGDRGAREGRRHLQRRHHEHGLRARPDPNERSRWDRDRRSDRHRRPNRGRHGGRPRRLDHGKSAQRPSSALRSSAPSSGSTRHRRAGWRPATMLQGRIVRESP